MAARRVSQFPELEPLRLPDLDVGSQTELVSRGSFELRRFAGIDVSDRDLSGTTFTECELSNWSADHTLFRGAQFVETRLDRMQAPVWAAPRLQLREVELTESRLGAAEMYDANFQSVLIDHCKLGWVNLRASELSNVVFRDCVIGELDLVDSRLRRVSFEHCHVESLHLGGATLEHVDLRGLEIGTISDPARLRGATLSSSQAAALTRVFAAHLGILVED